METKVCSKCKEEKELTEFCRNKSKKGGFQSECKVCEREYMRKYRATDKYRERKRDYDKERRAKDKYRERRREYMRKYQITDKYREYDRNRDRGDTEKLNVRYVKKLILDSTPSSALRPAMKELLNAHPELIELKRLEIKTKRLLKKQTP